MGRVLTADRALGVLCVIAAFGIVFIWVPLDSGSGIAEKIRRKWEIGDGLAPSAAGALLGLAGLMLALRREGGPGLSRANVVWLVSLMAGLALSLLVMRWAGPALGALLTEGGYRPLRDTAPWKYIGYALGGAGLVTGLIIAVERRASLRAFSVGVLAMLAMIALYDLPFDDLLLPPNGDV